MNYTNARDVILNELNQSLGSVDERQTEAFIQELRSAEKVFVVGVGRVLLMLQAFAKRLNHLGIEANFVGAVDEPAITEKDVLVVGSGSGESAVPVAIAKIAKRFHARIIYIGSNAESTVRQMADLFVRIPCCTKLALEDEIPSEQPMSSLFEQSLLLYLDAVSMMIVRHDHLDMKSLWRKHANLE